METAPSNNEASSGTSALDDGLGVLPCPFCGKAETVEFVDSDTFQDLMPWDVEPEGHTLYWAVMCDASKPGGKGGCGASGGFAPTKEVAAERWNTRTPNVRSQATDAALSRQVACTDGLGVAVPPAPTFENGGKHGA